MKEKILSYFKNYKTLSRGEKLYNLFALTVIFGVIGFLIFKNVTTANAVRGILGKANINYERVSCNGVFYTDCRIENASLNNMIKAETITLYDILNVSKENGESRLKLDVENIVINEVLAKALTTFSLVGIAGFEDFNASINHSNLSLETGMLWKENQLIELQNLNTAFKSNFIDVELTAFITNLNGDPVVKKSTLKFNTNKIIDTVYNRYNSMANKHGVKKANLLFFNIQSDKKLSKPSFKQQLLSIMAESTQSEIDFYKQTEGFYKNYYSAVEKFLKNEADVFTVEIENKNNLPASILKVVAESPNSTALDVKIKTEKSQ